MSRQSWGTSLPGALALIAMHAAPVALIVWRVSGGG